MAEIKEITAARRKRNNRRTLKKIIFFSVVIVIFISAVIIKENVSRENVFALFSDFFGTMGTGEEYPINIPGSATRSLSAKWSGVGVITDTQFITYNKNGKETGAWMHGFNNPVLKRHKNKFLLIDRGGRTVKVYSKTRLLHTETFENTVYGAEVSGRYIAVTTASRTHSCEVNVYNTSYRHLLTWYCSDGRVTDIAVDDLKSVMYLSVVRTESGVYYTDVYSIGIRSQKETGKITLEGTLGVSLMKLGNRIALVGDGRTDFLNSSLQSTGRYEYSGKILSGVGDSKNGSLILALSDNDNGRGTMVCLVNSSGEEKGNVNIPGEIKSVDGYKNKIICAYGDEVMIYDTSDGKTETLKTDIDVYDVSAGSDGIYLLSVSKINRIA